MDMVYMYRRVYVHVRECTSTVRGFAACSRSQPKVSKTAHASTTEIHVKALK